MARVRYYVDCQLLVLFMTVLTVVHICISDTVGTVDVCLFYIF